MYIESTIPDLVKTLLATSNQGTDIYIAHGRNRQAEATFLQLCNGKFSIAQITSSNLDETYQTIDVDVLQLRKI